MASIVCSYLAVPPVCIRPSVEMDGGAGSNEDDITTRLLAVCDMSVSIRRNLDKGVASWATVMEQWDFLQARACVGWCSLCSEALCGTPDWLVLHVDLCDGSLFCDLWLQELQGAICGCAATTCPSSVQIHR
jgi:RNA polymerase Rpb1, domain 1